MTTSKTDRELTGREWTGRGVFLTLAAFFGVVFAVNIFFVVTAVRTYTGVVAQEPYRKGLAYNQRIDADAQQAQLGWTAALTADKGGCTRLDLVAADGRPVSGLTVTGTLSRPSTAAFDRPLTYIETAPGRYESGSSEADRSSSGQANTGEQKTTVAALESGTWIVTLAARDSVSDAEPVYQLRRRLWLKP